MKILPMTPDDPSPGLEEWMTKMEAMGPMEFEPGEREKIAADLAELDRMSKTAIKPAGRGSPDPARARDRRSPW